MVVHSLNAAECVIRSIFTSFFSVFCTISLERCQPKHQSQYATVLCQQRYASSVELQRAFFAVFPKGLVFIHSHRDGSYITSHFTGDYLKGDPLVSLRGKPGGADRFKFIPDNSGSGVLIQVATLDNSDPPVPIFKDNEGYIVMMYQEDSKFDAIPALSDRGKATIFNVISQSTSTKPPFALQ